MDTGWDRGWSNGGVMQTRGMVNTGGAPEGLNYARTWNQGTTPGAVWLQTLNPMPVVPGDVWHMSGWARNADPAGYVYVACVGGLTPGAAQYFEPGSVPFDSATNLVPPADGVWRKGDLSVVIPPGVFYARMAVVCATDPGGRNLDVDDVRFTNQAASTGQRWQDVDPSQRWMDATGSIDWK